MKHERITKRGKCSGGIAIKAGTDIRTSPESYDARMAREEADFVARAHPDLREHARRTFRQMAAIWRPALTDPSLSLPARLDRIAERNAALEVDPDDSCSLAMQNVRVVR